MTQTPAPTTPAPPLTPRSPRTPRSSSRLTTTTTTTTITTVTERLRVVYISDSEPESPDLSPPSSPAPPSASLTPSLEPMLAGAPDQATATNANNLNQGAPRTTTTTATPQTQIPHPSQLEKPCRGQVVQGYHVVTRGTRVGIFFNCAHISSRLIVKPMVTHVSDSRHCKMPTFATALATYTVALPAIQKQEGPAAENSERKSKRVGCKELEAPQGRSGAKK
ncbi:hypothetical protein GGX14DRAFT_408075 [Mycena pura]|uniref:Uncharacterized protein n=1 Tax=Mycena pura TaxID=153505 RepID=A0AAD6UM38_9AGAR|nr:hypothetical protein GGX14DRAFT_408075 [Mycena pura]